MVSLWKLKQNIARKKIYKMIAKRGLRGRIQEIWPSRTEKDCYEMHVKWSDGQDSIELSSTLLRVGAEIRH